jgi:hypothetical protein
VSNKPFERRAPARRRSYNPVSRSRPDRVALWAFALGIFLILLAATTSNGQSGGAGLPGAPAREKAPPQAEVEAELGERTLRAGSSGADVATLQSILRARSYGPLKVTGSFDAATEAAVERFQREAGLAVDGVVGPETRPRLVALMRSAKATWYGPGLYGNRTACGKRLRPRTLGVAHKSLPCGTPVTFYRSGHFVTVPVIDRGPFRRGVAWDLTAAAARSIGMAQSGRLRSIH